MPTLPALNSDICSGFRSRDGGVHKPRECGTWKMAAEMWSVAEAEAYARFVDLPMSRPTIVKLCRDKNICRRKPGSRRWAISAAQFRQLLKESIT